MIITIGSVVKDDNDNIYKLTEIIGQGGFVLFIKQLEKAILNYLQLKHYFNLFLVMMIFSLLRMRFR